MALEIKIRWVPAPLSPQKVVLPYFGGKRAKEFHSGKGNQNFKLRQIGYRVLYIFKFWMEWHNPEVVRQALWVQNRKLYFSDGKIDFYSSNWWPFTKMWIEFRFGTKNENRRSLRKLKLSCRVLLKKNVRIFNQGR